MGISCDNLISAHTQYVLFETIFEDTEVVHRQIYNTFTRRINNDLLNTTRKTEDRTTPTKSHSGIPEG